MPFRRRYSVSLISFHWAPSFPWALHHSEGQTSQSTASQQPGLHSRLSGRTKNGYVQRKNMAFICIWYIRMIKNTDVYTRVHLLLEISPPRERKVVHTIAGTLDHCHGEVWFSLDLVGSHFSQTIYHVCAILFHTRSFHWICDT